jgi:cytochrome P450
MLEWSSAGFNALGPLNQRAQAGLPLLAEMMTFQAEVFKKDKLRPGGWAAQLFEAVGAGEATVAEGMKMMLDYLGPSLDTTIAATTNAIWLFAQHPEQWQALRDDPRLIPNAINEVVRLETPIQGFTRVVTRDLDLGEETSLPGGSRVLVLYGSANRDHRKWDAPDRFDITRAAADQVGFGHGVHRCAGANLARLEISALLTALLPRVREFRLENSERALNNLLRGWKSLKVTVH